MNLLLLPDSAALLVLIGVLAWVHRRYRESTVRLWLLGLVLVLVENVAVLFYRENGPAHRTLHVLALDAYILAAVSFGWASQQGAATDRTRQTRRLIPAGMLLVLATVYGAEVRQPALYAVIVAASLVLGLLFVFRQARPWRTRAKELGLHLGMWLPMLYAARTGNLRWVVYWGLACLYLALAASFRSRVRRDGVGGWAIVAGFSVWALCFALHPLLRGHQPWAALLQQVWTMQKFLVILGMLLVLLEDQTRRREAEALHDVLTGLPNRRLFEDRLGQALERANRSATFCAVFVVDLDRFKQANDRFGHQGGDQVLQLAARQLALQVRATDTLARCGGDEFSIIVGDIADPAVCEIIAGSLRRSVAAGKLNPELDFQLSCSVGYALYPRDAMDGLTLCQVADSRMYDDKRGERARLRLSA